MCTSKSRDDFRHRQRLLQTQNAPPYRFEGHVLKVGLLRMLKRKGIKRAEFMRRARLGRNTLHRVFNGMAPLRDYAYLWLLIRSMERDEPDVLLHDPSVLDA
jgi:hypothetical protein